MEILVGEACRSYRPYIYFEVDLSQLPYRVRVRIILGQPLCRYETPKKLKFENFRRSFLWEARYGSKNPGNVPFFFVGLCLFGLISVGGHKKNTDLWNCSSLSKHCTKPASEDEMCDVPKVGQITATPKTRCALGAGPHFQISN